MTKQRRSALGRGLGALISSPTPSTDPSPGASSGDGASPTAPAGRSTPAGVPPAIEAQEPSARGLREIPVDLIDPNPEQPRRHFDPDKLEAMAQSILLHGVLQPVVVRQVGDRYELIVGERRWRGSRAAGLEKIPAVVADLAPQDRLEVAIVENVQRHDLNPMELAHAYRSLADAGATQEEIGRKVSIDRSSVANHLRLLELTRDLQQDVEEARLSMGHAKALLQVKDPEQRRQLRDQVVKRGLSVRATELLGRRIAGPAKTGRARAAQSAVPLDPDLRAVLVDLEQRYQTKVKLAGDGKQGRIEISYVGDEELSRITSLLLGDAR
jgi:ParB family chromosome partitioning protein